MDTNSKNLGKKKIKLRKKHVQNVWNLIKSENEMVGHNLKAASIVYCIFNISQGGSLQFIQMLKMYKLDSLTFRRGGALYKSKLE